MTISQAIHNAASGLNVAGKASAIVAGNVANSMNETYARRELEVSGRVIGGTTVGSGAVAIGASRVVDSALLVDRRASDGLAAEAGVQADFLARVEEAVGTSETAGSLTQRVSDLEAAIVSAASMPQSESRLQQILDAAKGIAAQINDITSEIQQARAGADLAIGRDVATVNDNLQKIADLNGLIYRQSSVGGNVNDLLDRRQSLIDEIAEIMPIQEVARDGNRVALYTTGGMELLEGKPAVLGFTSSPAVDGTMTVLSGLTINGVAIATGGDANAIAGGRLSGNFAVRDELGVEVQAEVDALARNLIERFSDPATDATLGAGAAGLFTDAGAPLDPASQLALGARISVNALADPASGGALWRLRDGLGATAQGEQGNASGLNSLAGALSRILSPASGSSTLASDFLGTTASFLSTIATDRQRMDSDASFRSARADTLRERELSNGVDTDQEMQKLLLIEEAYAANARVLQAVDAMIQQLLEI